MGAGPCGLPTGDDPVAGRKPFIPPFKTLTLNQSTSSESRPINQCVKAAIYNEKKLTSCELNPARGQKRTGEQPSSIGIEILEDRARQNLPQLVDRPLVGNGQLLRISPEQNRDLFVGLTLDAPQKDQLAVPFLEPVEG